MLPLSRSLAVLIVFLGLGLSETHAQSSPVNMEMVKIGSPGNPGELSGTSAGGLGHDRVCGAVDYEYRIGRYEVTAAQYCAFLNAIAASDRFRVYHLAMEANSNRPPYIDRSGEPGSYTYTVKPGKENYPAYTFSWINAARFANWMHNGQPTGQQDISTTETGAYDLTTTHQYYNPDGTYDLANDVHLDAACLAMVRDPDWRWAIASDDEWHKAAFHKNDGPTGNYWDFATASNSTPSNTLIDPDPGNTVTYFHNSTLTAPEMCTPVGAHENSASAWGTFDQSGNVWEWTDTVFDSAQYTLRGGEGASALQHIQANTRLGSCPMGPSSGVGVRLVQSMKCGTTVLSSGLPGD